MAVLADRYWETKRLEDMNREEWEALCDGCGKCCLHKLEDDDTGEIYPDQRRLPPARPRAPARCKDYKHRHAYVPECVRLTRAR